ncbi:hypothetical protein POPTR_017G015600v4 [Populus trichocarpa]|uniref:Phospholipid-transporting ATPase n=1 Tax=Populus trichocarpa TaxID=3694 RepID=A0A3N7HYY4_POPTR|nr:putative disease resistance RPP13-like protein 1 [Populus trichocarpa]RQP01775.2 hypothetical protein POPTR_017G015600v4 [Populus trichocarpa]
MAVEYIGRSILFAVIEVLGEKLTTPEILGFFKSHKLNDGLLGKLKETLNTLNGLLDDAEEKQITKPAVQRWLNDARHAVYEAEDLMEEIEYEHLRSKDIKAASRRVRNRVRNLFPILNPANKRMKEMEAGLQKIYEKLERLVKHKGDLRHIEGNGGGRPLSEKTTPVVDESHVYGREADKEAIMKYLLTKNNTNGANVGVIPIVGMGGVGKTTLAQLIYKDRRVDKCFELKAWVWASQQFDVTRIVDDILKKINAGTCGTKEPDESLMEAVKGKKLLLVLDDAWNIVYNEWVKLLLPLQYAEPGSKIVVTTRNEDVAKVTQTVIPSHHLKGISDEDCWQLFARHAFSGANSGAVSHLETFGREIARKCKGLPLAAKTLGGLLHSVGDVKQWEKISKSRMWGLSNENIPPALTLSYYYLPSHLKRCFAYCAIFPKGYVFEKNQVITSWMAQGFLVQSRGVEEMEEIGDKYFNDLVSRSLFQQSLYAPSYFSMHDLTSDLAEYMSGEFCFKFVMDGESGSGLEGENSCTLPESTRHLSITSTLYDGVSKIFPRIHGVQHLRTLSPLTYVGGIDSEVLNDMLTNLKRLRTLSLYRWSYKSSRLPNSIGNLKHLRHLDLSQTLIKRLPESVSTLYYLQTLLLRECRHLMELPSNISNLVDLQHLDIEGTNLKEMPPKMGKLTKLRTLQYYIVGKESGSSMKELGKLSHIRKKLSIRNLRDVANAQDALDANLKGKKKIEKLRLIWVGNTDDTQHERDVLEKLEPSENVKQLVITGYGGTMFPGWFGNSSFSNMVALTLSGCKNCISLPPLGQLSSLEELQIKGFDEVVAVDSEFYGSDSSMEKPFKSLKILKFEGMKKWQEWNTDVAAAFPHLAKLLIAGCPELTNGLPNHLPSLLILEIRACPQLVVSIPEAPLLTEINVFDGSSGRINASVLYGGGRCLQFREYPQLKGMEQMSHVDPSSFTDVEIDRCSSFNSCRLDLLPQVSTLTVKQCLNLESLCIGERSLPALRHLTVRHCPNLVSFPEGGLAAPDLTSLVLEGCLYLKSLPENMHSLLPSLEDLQLRSLPEVDSFPEGGLPSKLHTLCIVDCIKLKVCGLQALPSLSCFRFTGNDVESFDEETLPSTLKTLKIKRLGNLKSLDYKGLHHLTSLRKLSIEGCPKLESISEQALPSSLECLHLMTLESLDYMGLQHITSLRKLKIWSCPKLASLQGLPSSLECLQLWDQRGRDSKELQHLTSLRTLILKSPKLESLPEEMLPSSLENLEILNLEDLEYKGLRHLTSLRKLRISSSPKLESVPGEGLPSSLVSLQISDLRNLKSLNYMGLQHFTSLRKLLISHSPKLEFMPEEGLPPSLEYLKIIDCPLLATRCERETGEDWPKISHIRSIKISN